MTPRNADPKHTLAVRRYSTKPQNGRTALRRMEQISENWGEQEDRQYLEKAFEEWQEFVDGPEEDPKLHPDSILMKSDTRFSESISVVLTQMHWMRSVTGLTYEQLVSILAQRYVEQAERYSIPTGSDGKEEGSTRIVWKHDNGFHMVLKVFDDHWSKSPKGPATLKFWRVTDIQKAFDSWTSSAVEFDPTDREMDKYMEILDTMLDGIPI
jgi:hypothetical protein